MHRPTTSRTGRASWGTRGGPRRFLDRLPFGVPLAALAVAFALALGRRVHVVPDGVAWGIGGLLFLAVEVYAIYALLAWRTARRVAAAVEVERDSEPRRLLVPPAPAVPPADLRSVDLAALPARRRARRVARH